MSGGGGFAAERDVLGAEPLARAAQGGADGA
jgi:hypothetical protein